MKKIYIIALLFSVTSFAWAQQMFQIQQFAFNPMIYNPAATGVQETEFNIGLVSRIPTGGIEISQGAPQNNFMWLDNRFTEKNMALGLNMNYSSYGANKQTDVMANYAYFIHLGGEKKLSMGLRAGVTNIKYDINSLFKWDDDPSLVAAQSSYLLPKFGLGLWYDSRTIFAGASAPDLITVDNNAYLNNKDYSFFDKKRNYTATTGVKIKLGDQYKIQPSAIVYYYPTSDVVAGANVVFTITDYFWLGISGASNKTVGAMAGTYISSRFRLGYAFESNRKFRTDARLNTHELNLVVMLDDLFK